MYPVSADEVLNLNIALQNDAQLSLVVYDIVGKRLIDKRLRLDAGSFTHSIDISTLTSGAYFVSLTTADGQRLVKRFLKD